MNNIDFLPNGDAIIKITPNEEKKKENILDKVRLFAKQNHVELGIVEMAAGAACLTFGIQSGAIQMGQNLVALATGKNEKTALLSGLIVGSRGALLGAVIGGIGIAGGGGAIGVPGALVCMGAAWIFGCTGFTVTHLIQKFIGDLSVDFGTLLTGGSLLAVGTFLLLDGAWRCVPQQMQEKIKDKTKQVFSMITKGIIYLAKSTWKVIADSVTKMADLYVAALKILESAALRKTLVGAGGTLTTTAVGLGGGILGSSIAASSVTVLGSHALGGAALALGIISAPLWPAVVLGASGAAIGGATYIAIRKLFAKKIKDEELLALQLALQN